MAIKRIEVSKKEYGDKYPFTIDKGEICNDDGAVYFEAGEEKFALNGIATMRQRYKNVREITIKDIIIGGVQFYKPISDMIELGNSLKD